MILYIGTYTTDLESGKKTGSQGIYLCEFNDSSGEIRILGTESASENPSFLAASPSCKLLLAANEKLCNGALDTYRITENGHLIHLDRTELAGTACCYVSLPTDGGFALGAHYGEGEVFSYSLNKDGYFQHKMSSYFNEGSGPVQHRQECAHAHSAKILEESKTVVSCDLGCDRIRFFRYDPDGKLHPHAIASIDTPAGCGPRHCEALADGDWLYVVCELSNEVLFYQRKEDSYTLRQRIHTLPDGYIGANTAADIHLGRNNRLYVSNRGDDSIVWYEVADNGSLTFLGRIQCGGKTPRNFAVTKNHIICANQSSGTVTVLRLDKEGNPRDIIHEIKIPCAACVMLQTNYR